MKIIITGASGFIGNRLLQAARSVYGTDVTAFSSYPAEGSHIVYRSTSDFGLTSADHALVQAAKVLIHAGAFIPKSGTEVNQFSECNGNISFTEKLLALPWNRLKKIVFLSTVDAYANVKGPINEATSVMPASLYGLSKLYGERMVSLYAAEHGIASQILRIGHVYGPGEEKYAKVLPTAIRNIVAGKAVELWGNGKALRSFIYIDDVVKAILNAVELQEEPGIINVAGGHPIAIGDLLKRLIMISGRDTCIEHHEFSGVTRDLVFDNAKLKRYLLPQESDFMAGLRAEFRHIENLHADQP